MKRIITIAAALITMLNVGAQSIIDSTKAVIISPDKNYVVTFYQKQLANGTRSMYYTLNYKQQPIIAESVLDIQLDNHLSERAMALKVDKPGEFVVTARRKGDDWFIGAITNNNGRSIQLSFDFLPKGKKYTATIYGDDDTVQTKTKVGIQKKIISSATILESKLKPSGGQAIWLTAVIK
ncbi:MAG TPA: glycoside hydrolase family 97 C-terminal domain-containing protein [Niastella sp.]|nr:glycoside hydrolase family 97 C-terminal domain-containing protein [Niastella sp.]